jgi:hypothetical protein
MAQSSVPGGNMFTVSFYLRNVRHNRKVTFFLFWCEADYAAAAERFIFLKIQGVS